MDNLVMDQHFRSLRDRDADRVRKTTIARARLDADIDAFIASGGRIQNIPRGLSGIDYRMRNGRYVNNTFTQVTVGNRPGIARARS